ncbi:MAG: T9SS type A sorting domain-containing protein [Bacteroidaceae bacterium]|nr:T9SS type A sorting domain-containing protein [Bacteroidaceae bacterium]
MPVKVTAAGTATVCKLVVKGAMTLNGATLKLDFASGQDNIIAGTSFYLFNMANVTSVSGDGFVAIEPEVPGDGLVWDTSKLLTNGRLNVVEASAIRSGERTRTAVWPTTVEKELHVTAPAQTEVLVYNMVGNVVATATVQDTEAVINMSAYPSNIYLVKVGDGKVFRVVKK